ncbi:histone deacetylase family protein [Paucidesulfovibrio longus]|uniref:histone deacetylase family protein n=1 Tax=Paucidesulfovibrio longus TaxID=889 RepID=UPI0003B45F4E|nr:histone deacetylase family protein [Paucidesulfovibrio longus]
MFRIRRIFDDLLPRDREVIRRVQEILREQFPGARESEYRDIPAKLRNPLKHRFRTILHVAEKRGQVMGFALMLHVPDLAFSYLDYISAAPGVTGGGVGAALYARLREEARFLHCSGIFFECAPDDPKLCPGQKDDKEHMAANRARMRFYERFGARTIVNTAYETPLKPDDDDCPPCMVFDDLGTGRPLERARAQEIIRAILERKYGKRCPEGYVDMVVESFRDDPVRLRPLRKAPAEPKPAYANAPLIALTVNDKHDIHHVHERGYVESPARVRRIAAELEKTGLFGVVPVKKHPERELLAVHDPAMVSYFKRAVAGLPEGKSIYPYVFPIRNAARPPKELPVRAGYYCIDTFTPLNGNAYLAARRAVDCALTAAERILDGDRLAYALVRPPGHHAERRSFGGFCYFNNAAVAANRLSTLGRVAVLDVDYHHGNGTQDIFYERGDVLTVSIHGHPSFAYPYFSGFGSEHGAGPGRGANMNIPLPELVNGEEYRKALHRALSRVAHFRPTFLVVALGLDPAKGDPTGTWSLTAQDFEENGKMIGSLGLPTLVVQEGGYRIPSLGQNARRFFLGLREGAYGRTAQQRRERALAEGTGEGKTLLQ